MPAELTITVARSGGFAGLTRTWSLSAALDESEELLDLVKACPWRSVRPDTVSRDRFVYLITVRVPRTRRTATVPESSLTGPWKSLVERVQQQHPAPSPTRTPPRTI
jgi:hypothetical protein